MSGVACELFDSAWSLRGRILAAPRLVGVEGSVCLVVVHVAVLVALLTASTYGQKDTVALHRRHGNTFACSSPQRWRAQDSVSKATIPACMALGAHAGVGLYSNTRNC